MDLESWAGSIELGTPAGQLLKKLVGALPKGREFALTASTASTALRQLEPPA